MDNKSYIGQEFNKGNKVYIIDDYDERAMCYDPKSPMKVRSKKKNGQEFVCDITHPSIFESTLNGRIVSAEEFYYY